MLVVAATHQEGAERLVEFPGWWKTWAANIGTAMVASGSLLVGEAAEAVVTARAHGAKRGQPPTTWGAGAGGQWSDTAHTHSSYDYDSASINTGASTSSKTT